jgi:hypothetical protein
MRVVEASGSGRQTQSESTALRSRWRKWSPLLTRATRSRGTSDGRRPLHSLPHESGRRHYPPHKQMRQAYAAEASKTMR